MNHELSNLLDLSTKQPTNQPTRPPSAKKTGRQINAPNKFMMKTGVVLADTCIQLPPSAAAKYRYWQSLALNIGFTLLPLMSLLPHKILSTFSLYISQEALVLFSLQRLQSKSYIFLTSFLSLLRNFFRLIHYIRETAHAR